MLLPAFRRCQYDLHLLRAEARSDERGEDREVGEVILVDVALGRAELADVRGLAVAQRPDRAELSRGVLREPASQRFGEKALAGGPVHESEAPRPLVHARHWDSATLTGA